MLNLYIPVSWRRLGEVLDPDPIQTYLMQILDPNAYYAYLDIHPTSFMRWLVCSCEMAKHTI